MKDLEAQLDRALKENRLEDAAQLLCAARAPALKDEPLAFDRIQGALPIKSRRPWWLLPTVALPVCAALLLLTPQPQTRTKGPQICDRPALRIAKWQDGVLERLDSRSVARGTLLAARAQSKSQCWIGLYVVDLKTRQARVLSPPSVYEPNPDGGAAPIVFDPFELQGAGRHLVVLTASPDPSDIDAQALVRQPQNVSGVAFDVITLEVP